MLSWLSSHSIEIFAVLFSVSEMLALIPAVKANSIFELVYGWLKKAAGK